MIRDYIRQAYRAGLSMIYARRDFKLLLKAPPAYVDLRLRQLASITDFFSPLIRPVTIHAPFGDSMLVVAPHQDDEAIGCGGALALQVLANRVASVVILQDGADGYQALGLDRQNLARLRNEESRRAARVLNMEPPRFLNHVDLAMEAPRVVEELRRIIMELRVDAVFAPFPLDGHPDHVSANSILADALATIDWDIRIFGYEVWGLCIPNVIVVIDEVMEQKIQMLSCFEFANKALNYTHSTKGLNMYRSRLLGAGICQYAECFFEAPKCAYIDLVQHLRSVKQQSQHG
jgi:LmbE family N-acetylglucosaminyl deacetylase